MRWLGLLLLSGWLPASGADTVKYSELREKRLPYGKKIIIQGLLNDFRCENAQIADHLQVSAIKAWYQGQEREPEPQPVSGNEWSVPIGPLPPNQTVTVTFQLSGKLKAPHAREIVEELINSDEFRRRARAFYELARQLRPEVQAAEASEFLRGLAPSVAEAVKRRIPCVSLPEELNKSIITDLRSRLGPLLNLQENFKGMVDFETLGVQPDSTYRKAYAATTQLPQKTLEGKLTLAGQFRANYDALAALFERDLVLEISQTASLEQAVSTTDLEKYAGFDVGALYVPRIEELRSFFTINVYPFGPVELNPAGLTLPQRISLTAGVSIGDISGRTNSRIKGENAFVYGLGFRLNKYFRISCGALLFRSAGTDNKLRHEFYVGPAIDITGLAALRTIFARSAAGAN